MPSIISRAVFRDDLLRVFPAHEDWPPPLGIEAPETLGPKAANECVHSRPPAEAVGTDQRIAAKSRCNATALISLLRICPELPE
jgi:hypothetical protein